MNNDYSLTELAGKRIRTFRIAQGKTLRDLSGTIGVSEEELLSYEEGIVSLNLNTLKNLSRALKIPARMLVE